MYETLLFKGPVNLKKNSFQCNGQCVEIVNYIGEYLSDSKTFDDFILAMINLKEYKDFDDFLEKAIGPRRRAEFRKAIKEDYYTKILTPDERNRHRDELFAINTSTTERQGVMSEEYFQYPAEVPSFTCPYHFQKTYAAFTPDHQWIGYIYPRFCGEVAGTYRILGHAGHFGKINFMLLLIFNLIKDLYKNHPEVRFFEYHLMYVGKQGLQDWKKNAGFRPTRFIGEIR